jgi:hypothetical protein
MTTTTTPHATERGPVVVSACQIPAPSYVAMTSAVDRFLQAETAMRESLEPVARMARDLGAEVARMASASETVARQITASMDALRSVRQASHPAFSNRGGGHSASLARLDREARRIAHGNARLGVRIAYLLTLLRENGYTARADLVARALRGDEEIRAAFTVRAEEGDEVALLVLEILSDLNALQARADALASEVAHLVASATLTDLPETAEPAPPPRLSLAGSIDLCAPPAQTVSATAGNVLPAERSPMR